MPLSAAIAAATRSDAADQAAEVPRGDFSLDFKHEATDWQAAFDKHESDDPRWHRAETLPDTHRVKNRVKWGDTRHFDSDVISAVQVYTTSAYQHINELLREGGDYALAEDAFGPDEDSEEYEEWARKENLKGPASDLRDAFRFLTSLDKPIRVFRGIETTPRADTPSDGRDVIKAAKKAMKENRPFVARGFVSTTTDPSVAYEHMHGDKGWMMLIAAKKGLDISGASSMPEEKEFLLDHKSHFIVHHIDPKRRVIHMEQIK